MKHERNSVKHHLSQKHELTWAGYKERTNNQHLGGSHDMGTFVKTEASDTMSFVKEEVLEAARDRSSPEVIRKVARIQIYGAKKGLCRNSFS